MDMLQQRKQERERVLQSEKYLRVKKRASELTGKNIILKLANPENMTVYGNYNARTFDRPENIYTITVPYDSKRLDLPEDSLLAFVLSEYSYCYCEDTNNQNRDLFYFILVMIMLLLGAGLVFLKDIGYYKVPLLFAALPIVFFVLLIIFKEINVHYTKNSVFHADKRSLGFTGNPNALINLLESFKNIEILHFKLGIKHKSLHKNNFLQKRIDKLQNEKFNHVLFEPESESSKEYEETPPRDILPQFQPGPKEEKPSVYDMLKERNEYQIRLKEEAQKALADNMLKEQSRYQFIKIPKNAIFTDPVVSSKSTPVFLYAVLIIVTALVFWGVKYGFDLDKSKELKNWSEQSESRTNAVSALKNTIQFFMQTVTSNKITKISDSEIQKTVEKDELHDTNTINGAEFGG
ncbi:MAG: hypothetical protein FWH43_02010 [Endomicrobia bacterium]|nr:hypothetical protein [Endomicrobiia bacterium]